MATAGMEHLLKMSTEAGEREADQEVNRRDRSEHAEWLEERGVEELPCPCQLHEPNNGNDRGVLYELNQEPDGRWKRDPDGLRQDNVRVLLRRAQGKRG